MHHNYNMVGIYNEVGRVCDKSGQVLYDEEEVRKRWREYFASLLQGEEVQ